MKRICSRRSILAMALVSSLFFLPACRPDEVVPTPEPGPKVARETVAYVAGWGETDDESWPAYWQDGRWIGLGVCRDPGVEWPVRYAFSVFVSGSDVYTAGYSSCESRCTACYWKNGVRTDLRHPAADSYAKSIHVSGDDVYVAGWIDFGDYTIPCYWKNGVRIELSRFGPSKVDQAAAIVVSGGDVYIAGTVNRNPDASLMISSPCYWKNGERVDLKGYDGVANGFGNSICVSRGKVYVAGNVAYGGNSLPCYWVDGVRHDLKQNIPGWANSIQVSEMDVSGGMNVYIAGMVLIHATSKMIPCVWKNNVRTELDVADSGYAGSIFVLDNDVFVAGFGSNNTYYNTPCYWKNGARTDLVAGPYAGGCAQAVFATYK
jgi:hypothetical protein